MYMHQQHMLYSISSKAQGLQYLKLLCLLITVVKLPKLDVAIATGRICVPLLQLAAVSTQLAMIQS